MTPAYAAVEPVPPQSQILRFYASPPRHCCTSVRCHEQPNSSFQASPHSGALRRQSSHSRSQADWYLVTSSGCVAGSSHKPAWLVGGWRTVTSVFSQPA